MTVHDGYPLLDHLLVARKKSLRKQSIGILLLFVVLTVLLVFVSDDVTTSKGVFKAFLKGSLGIAGGAIFMLWAFVHDPFKNRLRQRLLSRMPEVVWIYGVKVSNAERIGVAFGDKKIILMSLYGNIGLEPLMTEIAAQWPGAVIGYSEARMKAFRQNPRAVVTIP